MLETVRRTFQLAHVMGGAGRAPTGDDTDNARVFATSPRSRSSRRSPTASPTTSGRSSPAAWPTSCCGIRRRSASSRRPSSRVGSSPGRPSARATPRSRARSRPATGPTGAAWPAPRRRSRRRSRRLVRRASRPSRGTAGGWSRSTARAASPGVAGAQPGDRRDRGRCPRRRGHARWAAAGDPAVREVPLSRRYLLR